jgi:hypothetical protein
MSPTLDSGWKEKRWYVIVRGHETDVFFDYWYEVSALLLASSYVVVLRANIELLVKDNG